jgi:hypothetical protein
MEVLGVGRQNLQKHLDQAVEMVAWVVKNTIRQKLRNKIKVLQEGCY